MHYRQVFDEEFCALLFESSNLRTIYFIKSRLKQFSLGHTYSAAYVLIEAYLRGCRLIESGGRIEKVIPWVRQTAYNIVRELSREHRKLVRLSENLATTPYDDALDCSQELFSRVKQAFGNLPSEDQKLLTWKIVDDLPWEEIYRRLTEMGETEINVVSLRKRKERALARLRRAYHCLEHTTGVSKIKM